MRSPAALLGFALCLAVSAGVGATGDPFFELPTPRFDPAPASIPDRQVFTLVHSAPNQITDMEEWLVRNGLPRPRLSQEEVIPVLERLEARDVVVETPTGFDGGDSRFLVDSRYSRFLAAVDSKTGAFKYAFDFGAFAQPPGQPASPDSFTDQELAWAVEKDGTLYVSHRHRTYAKESKGLNGYVTAIDPVKKTILWRSPSLVANADSFAVVGEYVVSGYGFTAEPDYLYLLRRRDGRIAGRTKLKTGPERIVEKDGLLYVRSYDTDYVFRLSAGK